MKTSSKIIEVRTQVNNVKGAGQVCISMAAEYLVALAMKSPKLPCVRRNHSE